MNAARSLIAPCLLLLPALLQAPLQAPFQAPFQAPLQDEPGHGEGETQEHDQEHELSPEHFRQEHAEIRERLARVRERVGSLHAGDPRPQEAARDVVRFFTEHIAPHAQVEEQTLYPAVDRVVGSDPAFTSSMRHDHRIVERWIGELEAAGPREGEAGEEDEFDAVAFARRADRLLGLLEAHFEKEEVVLLPLLEEGR